MNNNDYPSLPVKSSEITPQHIYNSRRDFIKLMGSVGLGALISACTGDLSKKQTPASSSVTSIPPSANIFADDLGKPLTPYDAVTGYVNYYEFTPDKQGVAQLASGFQTRPWELQVYGLVNKPKTFGFEDIQKLFTTKDRVYRMRCVEGWSMVIPWLGFPLSKLLMEVEPMSSAQYVRFETITRPDQMPGQSDSLYPWPYQEGLRLDEAMNDLTILSTGLYGKELLPQNGAPIRLVVPWKYGFKSIKSIVKIELVSEQPSTFWSAINPGEYGFYSNVNPDKPHPRWSQATERRIGENSLQPTLMFNGYAEQVAGLYKGMDLIVNY